MAVIRVSPLALPLAFLLTLTAFAGCIQQAAQDLPLDPAEGLVPRDDLVAHTAAGVLPLPEGWDSLRVRLAVTGYNGGEPTLGVTSDGTLFASGGGARIIRSDDHGATWTVVGDPIRDPKTSLDPWVWVDPLTDRVFNAPLYVACTWMTWSDDKGATWDVNPAAGCGIPAHDHQKVTTGPPAEGVTTTGYPNVIYYAYNSFRQEGSWVSVSLDGGKTFSIGQSVHPKDCHSGINGPVAVAPDGTAYLPKAACEGVNIAVSKDSGKTWEITGKVNDAGIGEALATMVDAAVDAAGNAYVAYTGKDGRTYLTVSTDGGDTWSPAKRVSPPAVTSTVFPVISAGADGRIAVGYVGTTADTKGWDSPDAQDAAPDTRWHLYLTFADAATAEDPLFVTQRVTPEEDPVQIGCIWQSGGSNPCRNLLDFIDMVERDGRTYLVFADGCVDCKSNTESRRAAITVAIVEEGPSLLGGLLQPLGTPVVDANGTAPSAGMALPRLR